VKALIIGASLALAAPQLASAAQQVWKLDGDVGGFIYTQTCTLDIGDGKIDGGCNSADNPAPVKTTGTYTEANGVTTSEFVYDVKVGDMPYHVIYKGQSQSDGSVKGTVDANGNPGTFTAVRQN
jgi:hypothetical protein